MEENKLDLDAPFLSVRRFPTTSENPSESENIKQKTTTKRIIVKDSCQETEHETPVRLLQDDQSFDHVMEPSSVPFLWEQTPGKPKDHMATTLLEEPDLIKALDVVSSTASFGVSEFEKNGERLSNVSRDDDVILEFRDFIMSRFLPAAEAIAMKQKKEAFRVEEKMKKKKKKQSIALQRVSKAINQDLNNDNDNDDDYDHNHFYSTVSKKALFGLCSKNSLDVFNPVLYRVKTCQNLGVKSGKIVNPELLDSVKKTKSSSSSASLPKILKTNRAMSKRQELYPIPINPSRLLRTTSTDQIQRKVTKFLAEEVKRRRNINQIRSGNVSETSGIHVSQPPLPKTPSESWLCRTLPRSSAASGQLGGWKKIEQKTNSQSINWETIVKTSYEHHDHVSYSLELNNFHPSRQQKS